MAQPQPAPAEWIRPLEFLCGECGEMVSVKDPAALLRALHLLNECTVSGLVAKSP